MKKDQTLKVLLLGGYGNAGRCIARYLLQEFQDAEIVIAGRDWDKAQATASELNRQFSPPGALRATARMVDAARQDQLIWAFSRADLVINAAGAIPFTRHFVEAAIQTKTDYVDTHLSSKEKWEILRSYEDRIREANVCYVTDGGFHPGVPAALVKYAATQLEELTGALVYGGLRIDWRSYEFSPATVKELVDEFRDFKPLVFQDGKWKKQSFLKLPTFDFGEPLGVLPCTPMDLEEMHSLPELISGLRHTGFYVSGFNPVVDNWILPVVYPAVKLLPRSWSMPFARLFHWGLKFSKPPYGLNLTAVCQGQIDGRPAELRISLIHKDGYVLTAAPVVAFVRQWRAGRIRRPGLWMQGHIVEPAPFLKDMERMGVQMRKVLSAQEEILNAV